MRRFSNGFIDFLYRLLKERKIGPDALQFNVDLQDAQVSLSLDHQGRREEFIIRETWWARVFQPPDLTDVFLWTISLIPDRIRQSLRAFVSLNPVTWLYALALFILLPVTPLLLFVVIFGMRLALTVPLLNQLLNGILSAIEKQAADFLVLSAGDLQVYAKDWVYSTEIRECLEEEISRVAKMKGVDDICIVGHSLGSLIAYESLSRTLPPLPRDQADKIRCLVTVGSPLENIHVFLEQAYRFRFQSPLPDRVRWLNLYSAKDLLLSRLTKFTRKPPENIAVSNKPVYMFLKEHSSYWQNAEVMRQITLGLVPSFDLAPVLPKMKFQAAQQWAQFYLPRKLTERL